MRARDVKIEALQDEAQTTQPIFGEGFRQVLLLLAFY